MGKDKDFFNFEYFHDKETKGGYFKKGESWGLLLDNELDWDFDNMVIIGAGNPIPQGDGSRTTPVSLTSSPNDGTIRTRTFHNSSLKFSRKRYHKLSSTRFNILSTDDYLDEEYQDQEDMTIITDEDDDIFAPSCPGLQRPKSFRDIELGQVLDLSSILLPTDQVVNMDNVLPLPVQPEKGQEGREEYNETNLSQRESRGGGHV